MQTILWIGYHVLLWCLWNNISRRWFTVQKCSQFSFSNQNNELIHNNKMQQQKHQELVIVLWSLYVILHIEKDNVRNYTSDPSKAQMPTEEWHIARDQRSRGGKGVCVCCKSWRWWYDSLDHDGQGQPSIRQIVIHYVIQYFAFYVFKQNFYGMSANIFIYFYVCFVDGGARTSTNSLTLSTQEKKREREREVCIYIYIKSFLGS